MNLQMDLGQRTWILWVAILASSGCGGGGAAVDASRPSEDSAVTPTDGAMPDATPTDSGTTPTDSGTTPTDSGTTPTDSGTMPTDSGTTPSLSLCQRTCASATDCATGSAAYGADNYACTEGACRYTGCNDDAECQSTFASPDYACSSVAGLNICVQRCTTSADCGSGSQAFDANNYRCDANRCVYTGCNDDDECASSFADTRYVCRAVVPPATGLPIPVAAMNCVLRCSVASDCATSSAAFDADNYECRGDACHYVGCNGDAECAASFSDTRYICR